jgi:hypothetical protein
MWRLEWDTTALVGPFLSSRLPRCAVGATGLRVAVEK